MAEHTKTPWEVRDDTSELQVIGWQKSDYYPNKEREDGLWPRKIVLIKATRHGAHRGGSVLYGEFSAEDKANVDFIVKACNLHDRMIAFLKRLIDGGSFEHSAIELDLNSENGDLLKDELDKILEAAGR